MNKSINKYLFYLGILFIVIFWGSLLIKSFFNDNPQYTLIVYNYSTSNEDLEQEYLEEVIDKRNQISGYSIGVLDMPDKRINVSQTPLYVLIKIKNREIVFVTDKPRKLNEHLVNETK